MNYLDFHEAFEELRVFEYIHVRVFIVLLQSFTYLSFIKRTTISYRNSIVSKNKVFRALCTTMNI